MNGGTAIKPIEPGFVGNDIELVDETRWRDSEETSRGG